MNKQLEAAEEMLKKMANENPIDARIQMALGAIHAMRGEKRRRSCGANRPSRFIR
jgi:Flp pilus assembly protein TadD